VALGNENGCRECNAKDRNNENNDLCSTQASRTRISTADSSPTFEETHHRVELPMITISTKFLLHRRRRCGVDFGIIVDAASVFVPVVVIVVVVSFILATI
jgi:hypothetical protein